MKFLSIRDLKTKSAQIWKELLEEKEMIITNNGHPIAVLSSIDENNLEKFITSVRRVRAMEAAASIQYGSAQKGTDKISIQEIDTEIQAVRKHRKK